MSVDLQCIGCIETLLTNWGVELNLLQQCSVVPTMSCHLTTLFGIVACMSCMHV